MSLRVQTCRRVVLTGAPAPADRGACQQIIDGKIKIKHGGEIAAFTPRGMRFSDGAELEADAVVVAIGYAPASLSGPPRATH